MYIKRNLEEKIKKYIPKKEIIAIIGPRQSGKTTMLKHLLSSYSNVNIITLDDVTTLNLFQNEIDSFIELYVKGFDYVFIDEIQYAQNSGKQLKCIYDTSDVKIFISGSSASEISINSLKFLVGRIFIFELLPLSFGEFLSFKDPKLYSIYKKKNFGEEITKKIQGYINEFLIYGGYPRVVISEDEEEKITVLKNIYSTLMLREIKDLFEIASEKSLIDLVKALSLQIGNLINYSELCDVSGLQLPKLKKYLNILELLYVSSRCTPFNINPRTEIVKNPKIYFIDLGLRNIIINNFSIERSDIGAMYENLIYSEFLKKEIKLNFWRTKSGAEVDFVYNNEPIEIKSVPKIGKSLQSFIKKFSPKNAYVISKSTKETTTINGTKIQFIPFAKFI